MFVTYEPRHSSPSRNVHAGNTVTILKRDTIKDYWVVSAYNPDGQLEEWVAHVTELNGFDGV